MADNTTLNPGAGGDIAATDDIDGVKFQRVKLTLGADGVNDGDASAGNPMPVAAYGELIEAIEAMRMAIQSLSRSIGQSMPDTAGRLRVLPEQPTAAALQATVSLASNQVLGTVNNQVSVGGIAATEQIPSLMRLGADSARRNITVS